MNLSQRGRSAGASFQTDLSDVLRASFKLDEHTVFAPASIGGVMGLSQYDTLGEVLRIADTALHEAKATPSQAFVIYEQRMTRRAKKQLSLDTELRQALAREEFVPFFQPILALEDGRVHGVEVLARKGPPFSQCVSLHC